MYQTGKLAQVSAEADRLDISILGLAETRWTGYGEKRIASGQVLLYSGPCGPNATHERGVGFLLSPLAFKGLMEWRPVSDRVIVARFKASGRNVTILQCYAPTDTTDLATKEAFYDQLTSTISSIHKKDVCVLMGDMNAQIGNDNSQLEHIMGRHALGSMTENGELFTEFCGVQDLLIGGSVFPHKNSHKVTWFSNDHTTENQIDHICISRRYRRCLEDVRNKRSADVGSDHHLLLGMIKMRVCKQFQNKERTFKRFDVKKLENPQIKTAFADELRDNINHSTSDNVEDVNEQWEIVKSAFLKTSENILGTVQHQTKDWMSQETWKAIEERRTAKIAINNTRTRGAKQRASQAWLAKEKEVKSLCRRDKNTWVNNLAQQAENAVRVGDFRTLYETTRKLSGKHALPDKPIKDKNGNFLTNDTQQLERWHEFYTELFTIPSSPSNQEVYEPPRVPRIQRVNSAAPSIREIEAAIRSMKSNKAPGIDRITAEMLKADTNLSAKSLHPIFTKIWENEEFPEDWLQGLLIKVPKKGDLSECDNWRGIMLLCVPVKILCKVLLNRFEEKVDATLRNAQAGFRPGRSCIDQINTLRIIIEQINEFQGNLHMVFIDFKKAFDMLHHQNIWNAMERKGIPTKLINLIKAQYTNFKCRVIHKGFLSQPISCHSGVRQGCILSPLLFLMVLDEVLTDSVEGKRTGIQWSIRSNDHLEDLDFADDIGLMSQKRSDMQTKLASIQQNARKVGLEINVSKTKSMYVGKATAPSFSLEGNQIEKVPSFTYLGSQISPDGGCRDDIKARIRKAQCAYGQLRNIWRSKQLSLNTKIRIFNSNVKSVLLYGCETWLVADDVTRKLQVLVNRYLRRLLGIFWPNTISNLDLHHKCHQDPIHIEIRRRKWNWVGHTLRRDANTISRQALDWNPQGKRSRGAPRRTWRRSLEIEIQQLDPTYSWRRVKTMANDRRLWKEIVSHLCD